MFFQYDVQFLCFKAHLIYLGMSIIAWDQCDILKKKIIDIYDFYFFLKVTQLEKLEKIASLMNLFEKENVIAISHF